MSTFFCNHILRTVFIMCVDHLHFLSGSHVLRFMIIFNRHVEQQIFRDDVGKP